MNKSRPIIRIWDLGNGDYRVDVDTLKITKNHAYSIMSVLAKIHKDEVKNMKMMYVCLECGKETNELLHKQILKDIINSIDVLFIDDIELINKKELIKILSWKILIVHS